MNSSMQSSEWVDAATTITGMAIVAFILLVLFVATAPARATANLSPWSEGELGTAAAYREPADLDEVDQRIEFYRARATAPVIHSPARLREPRSDALTALPARYVPGSRLDGLMSVSPAMSFSGTPATSRYRVPLTEFIADPHNAVDYWPALPAAPVSPAPVVGRHRRELIAA